MVDVRYERKQLEIMEELNIHPVHSYGRIIWANRWDGENWNPELAPQHIGMAAQHHKTMWKKTKKHLPHRKDLHDYHFDRMKYWLSEMFEYGTPAEAVLKHLNYYYGIDRLDHRVYDHYTRRF